MRSPKESATDPNNLTMLIQSADLIRLVLVSKERNHWSFRSPPRMVTVYLVAHFDTAERAPSKASKADIPLL
jgi:hypothetical protein